MAKPEFIRRVVDGLIKQNLQPPLSPFDVSRAEERRENGDSPWVMVGSNEEMDARDPRWFDLFQECFLKVEDTDEDGDDLLFFVRQAQYDDNSVFVRRRVGSTMPKLEDVVDWKGTFWLNLVVHLQCRLTVTVCQRQPAPPDPESGDRNSVDNERRGSGESPSKKKTTMRAMRRNSRKVFATPFKSNMQLKDTGHEPSFPLVYYAVNNFLDAELHLDIQPNEWLCVELAAVLPKDASGTAPPDEDSFYELSDDSQGLPSDLYAPFPCPSWGTKIIFFQGAASFSALSQVFLQKTSGIAQLGRAPLALFGKGDDTDRKEYITMRGPRGKGQCEVAVQDGSNGSLPKGRDAGPGSKNTQSGSGSVFDRIRKQLVSTVSNATSDGEGSTLRSSLTYINIHFAFIASDLLQFGKVGA